MILNSHGSSPHTRGTYTLQDHSEHPASVHPRTRGEHQHCSASRSSCHPVHPRTRGEHVIARYMRIHSTGSSPHTRGTCAFTIDRAQRSRFIPAHAGNIYMTSVARANSSVHPRTRGEHAWSYVMHPGTSVHPRTRGEHVRTRRYCAEL